jgi:hypothetical protein
MGGMGSATSTNVMFVLEPGARALPLGALTTSGYGPAVIGEIATAGTFRITNVATRTAPSNIPPAHGARAGTEYLEVTVEQLAPFAVEEVGRDLYVRSSIESFSGRSGAAAAGRGGSEAAGATRGSWVSDPNAEEVSVAFLRQFREQDRGRRSLGTNVDELAEQISTRGFDDALILEVDPSGRAVLIEGNHRLAAAEQLGLDRVPVRVITSSEGRLSGSGAEIAVREGLRPGNLLKPSDVFDVDILGLR